MSDLVLTAGPLQATLEPGRLRWVRWHGIEVLRGIELSVRDNSWATAIPAVVAQSVRRHRKVVTVRQQLEFQHRDMDLAASVDMELDGAGMLHVTIRAVARSTFERNRIGLIVLHPASVAGSSAEFRTDDSWSGSPFPVSIDPGIVATDLTGMRWRPSRSLKLTLELEGERWETEDQRNWTDASFKTYPTPLRIPFPVVVTNGTTIDQSLTLAIESRRPMTQPAQAPATLDVASGRLIRMPIVGAMFPFRAKPSPSEAALVRDLGLGAIRVAVDADRSGAADRIVELTNLAADAGVALDVELTVNPSDGQSIARSLDALSASRTPVRTLFAFDAGSATGYDSSDVALDAIRSACGSIGFRPVIGGGTRANFTELNRLRPDPAELTVGTYGVNPQVHAFDEASIVESLETLGLTVRQARVILGQRPISVVVTFRPRVNAAIGRARFGPDEGGPERADPRQGSAFLGAWSVGAVAGLMRFGVQSVALFETSGPAGLAQVDGGIETYPVGAVVATLAAMQGSTVRTASTRTAVAIAGSGPTGSPVLIANLKPVRQRIRIVLPWAGRAQARILAAVPWSGGPQDGWVDSRVTRLRGPQATPLELEPWQTMRIDRLDLD